MISPVAKSFGKTLASVPIAEWTVFWTRSQLSWNTTFIQNRYLIYHYIPGNHLLLHTATGVWWFMGQLGGRSSSTRNLSYKRSPVWQCDGFSSIRARHGPWSNLSSEIWADVIFPKNSNNNNCLFTYKFIRLTYKKK